MEWNNSLGRNGIIVEFKEEGNWVDIGHSYINGYSPFHYRTNNLQY